VWSLLLGNQLGITQELFDTCLSQSKHHIETNIIQYSGNIQYDIRNSNPSVYQSLFNLSNIENDLFHCVVCNFIFNKLNTMPIKREFTHAPIVIGNLTNSRQHYTNSSIERQEEDEEKEGAVNSTNSFKIDPLDFEQSNCAGSLVFVLVLLLLCTTMKGLTNELNFGIYY
ncbi:unnamed protein product, partial [Schistosoma turkestanicum]